MTYQIFAMAMLKRNFVLVSVKLTRISVFGRVYIQADCHDELKIFSQVRPHGLSVSVLIFFYQGMKFTWHEYKIFIARVQHRCCRRCEVAIVTFHPWCCRFGILSSFTESKCSMVTLDAFPVYNLMAIFCK